MRVMRFPEDFPITQRWPAKHPDRLQLYSLTTPNGVKIAGPLNLAGTIAVNASSLFAKNLFAFLEIMLDKKEKKLAINWDDELVKGTLVAKDAKIVHPNLAQQS